MISSGSARIAAGIAGYMVAWAFAVTVWRYLLLAELRALAERQRARASAATPAAVARTDTDGGRRSAGRLSLCNLDAEALTSGCLCR